MADELTERIIGAAIEVHKMLDPRLLKSIYEEAPRHAVVELKSLPRTPEGAKAQILSYLRAAKLRGGLLINFGLSRLAGGIQRFSI